MRLTIATWNINSVRLRINSVLKFLRAVRPDVLCLQETKCPDDKFPQKRFRSAGYEHFALNGQKGYHGVVVLSRFPLDDIKVQAFCGNDGCTVMCWNPSLTRDENMARASQAFPDWMS